MKFEKGQPKHPSSGRKKGVGNKKKILKVADFILREDKDIAREIYETIHSIQDPVAKTKALMDFYKFVDAPVKEKEVEDDSSDNSEASTANILAAVK